MARAEVERALEEGGWGVVKSDDGDGLDLHRGGAAIADRIMLGIGARSAESRRCARI